MCACCRHGEAEQAEPRRRHAAVQGARQRGVRARRPPDPGRAGMHPGPARLRVCVQGARRDRRDRRRQRVQPRARGGDAVPALRQAHQVQHRLPDVLRGQRGGPRVVRPVPHLRPLRMTSRSVASRSSAPSSRYDDDDVEVLSQEERTRHVCVTWSRFARCACCQFGWGSVKHSRPHKVI